MNVISSTAANAAAMRGGTSNERFRASKIRKAGEALLLLLERGEAIDAADLRTNLTDAFGGSDAEGLWTWKDAYEACEVAQVLFLRKFGAAIAARSNASEAALAMLTKIADLIPSHTRRSEESLQFQQFSTPIPLGYVAARAAGLVANDIVLEPSAGT